MIALAHVGAISWFIFNVWVTIACGFALKFGGLDCGPMIGRYSSFHQKLWGVVLIIFICAMWGGWIYLIKS